MTDSDVISAKYTPGLSSDLTYWEAFIGRNRRLRQKVVVWNQNSEFHNQVLWFWSRLSRSQFASLWNIVERIGFDGFRRRYDHQTMGVTDCESYRITVRLEGRPKEVEAYDMLTLSEFEQQPDMIGFQQLWNAITEHAPYGKVPMTEGLPRPWWRFF